MNGMGKLSVLAALCAAAILTVGCATGGGILIKPVSANQELKETTVSKDPGYFMDKIALIDLDGLILDAREDGLFGSDENPTTCSSKNSRWPRRTIASRRSSSASTRPAAA